jgi:hypothetical protein
MAINQRRKPATRVKRGNMPYMGFKKLAKKVKSKKLAAWIGRKKYGKKKFQNAAAKGKKLGYKGKK